MQMAKDREVNFLDTVRAEEKRETAFAGSNEFIITDNATSAPTCGFQEKYFDGNNSGSRPTLNNTYSGFNHSAFHNRNFGSVFDSANAQVTNNSCSTFTNNNSRKVAAAISRLPGYHSFDWFAELGNFQIEEKRRLQQFNYDQPQHIIELRQRFKDAKPKRLKVTNPDLACLGPPSTQRMVEKLWKIVCEMRSSKKEQSEKPEEGGRGGRNQIGNTAAIGFKKGENGSEHGNFPGIFDSNQAFSDREYKDALVNFLPKDLGEAMSGGREELVQGC